MLTRKVRVAMLGATAFSVAALWTAPDLQAQDAGEKPCFELHPGIAAHPPHAPLLLNRCTGETFVLIAGASSKKRPASPSSYRWQPIGKSRPAPELASPAAGTKCFDYDGRKFCH